MAENHVVIETKLGKLRGQTKKSVLSGKTFYSFQGIPFAKPPVGELRFKAPKPFGSWEGIREALKDGPQCKQPMSFRSFLSNPSMTNLDDEDCLYLCVCMTKLPNETDNKKPVMVSIHGGGFAGGTGNFEMTGPDFIMGCDREVIFVSFNYRCGAFGFLSLEDEEVPGNAGLKDQVLALKWVRDNIDSFGGDPNNVTIFGVSAGGASVDYHLISPLSKGLFHKAIVQSGSSNNPWAFQPTPRKMARKLAKALGCESDKNDEVLKCLMSASSEEIILASHNEFQNREYIESCGFVFSPCVEPPGSDCFLPDTPDNLKTGGHIHRGPVIIGCTTREGTLHSLCAIFDGVGEDGLISRINEKPELLVPSSLGLEDGSDAKKEAAEEIKQFYLKGEPLSKSNYDNYITTYQSDVLFNIGIEKTRTALLKHSASSIYSYVFSDHSRCFCKTTSKIPEIIKTLLTFSTSDACHGADCGFIYYSTQFGYEEPTTESKNAIHKYVNVWTKFAETGDPNCKELGTEWQNDSETQPCFMDIGATWELKKGIPFQDRFEFWKKLISKYQAR